MIQLLWKPVWWIHKKIRHLIVIGSDIITRIEIMVLTKYSLHTGAESNIIHNNQNVEIQTPID